MRKIKLMPFNLRHQVALLIAIAVVLTVGATQRMSAQDDVAHMVKGAVKSVDKDSKTMVVKASDGTEHSIKWTDKTAVDGGKEIDKDIGEGSKVSVKYHGKGRREDRSGSEGCRQSHRQSTSLIEYALV